MKIFKYLTLRILAKLKSENNSCMGINNQLYNEVLLMLTLQLAQVNYKKLSIFACIKTYFSISYNITHC